MTIKDASERFHLNPFYIHALICNKFLPVKIVNKEVHLSRNDVEKFMSENEDLINKCKERDHSEDHCPMYLFLIELGKIKNKSYVCD